MAVVVIVDALHADTLRATLAEILNELPDMFGAGDAIERTNERLGLLAFYEVEYFLILFAL